MEAVVIYESIFGNTSAIAHAIADGLAEKLTVRTLRLPSPSPADDIRDADLIVLGGPTHAFGMSRKATREEAAHRQGEGHPVEPSGIREWIDALPESIESRSAAVFDTRVRAFRFVPGSASSAAARRLQRKGLRLIDNPHSFYVDDMEGPLSPGELARADEWGCHLGRAFDVTHRRN